MNLIQYLASHPGQESGMRNLGLYPPLSPESPWVLRRVMLRFTEDTASAWAGPFPGGYACASLQDYGLIPNVQLLTRAKKYARHLKAIERSKSKRMRKNNKGLTPETMPLEYPIVELPVWLKIRGNDDTSWSKFFATSTEAIHELELLLACQPLHFDRDIRTNDYQFTN